MAIQFVVEDGTGLATATSYVSVDELKQFWDNVSYDYSSFSDGQLQQRLNKATEVLDGQYTTLWPGQRNSTTQALDWPRQEATYLDGEEIATTVVPIEVKKAISEIVYAGTQGTTLQPTHDDAGQIETEYTRVDVIETRTTYFNYTSQDTSRDLIIAVVDALARLIGPHPGGPFSNIPILRI